MSQITVLASGGLMACLAALGTGCTPVMGDSSEKKTIRFDSIQYSQ